MSRIVRSFDELLEPFGTGISARCWERRLGADFDGVAAALAPRAEREGGVLVVTSVVLQRTPGLDPRAVSILLEDLERLDALGRAPQLNVVTRYPRDERGLPVNVDVHSFHVDRAPVEADTFLCTYSGAPSEGLDAHDAARCIDDLEVREALRRAWSGETDFEAFLVEACFDLHFRPKPRAVPWSFGVGHLWRLTVAWPGATVAPCIHRAPPPDGRPRLLLIS